MCASTYHYISMSRHFRWILMMLFVHASFGMVEIIEIVKMFKEFCSLYINTLLNRNFSKDFFFILLEFYYFITIHFSLLLKKNTLLKIYLISTILRHPHLHWFHFFILIYNWILFLYVECKSDLLDYLKIFWTLSNFYISLQHSN